MGHIVLLWQTWTRQNVFQQHEEVSARCYSKIKIGQSWLNVPKYLLRIKIILGIQTHIFGCRIVERLSIQ